jgi:hypothetical protein
MIGPIFSKPPVPSTSVPERRTRVVWKIFRLFTMDQELRELVQEFYAKRLSCGLLSHAFSPRLLGARWLWLAIGCTHDMRCPYRSVQMKASHRKSQ